MKKTGLSLIAFIIAALLFSTLSCKKDTKDDDIVVPPDPTSVTDIDGNAYKVVRIGTQVWMAENLRVTRFNDGEIVPTSDPYDVNLVGAYKPVYQWITNYDTSLLTSFGRAYTWYAANHAKGLCPSGWHIPSFNEFQTMMVYLGDKPNEYSGKQGGKLKEAGNSHWLYSSFSNATNESGFTAYGGGERSNTGEWMGFLQWGYFIHSDLGLYRPFALTYGKDEWSLGSCPKNYGAHVRCIWDGK